MIAPTLSAAAARLAPAAENREVAIEAAAAGRVWVDGREMINMASCDYLGLAHDPRVVAAACGALNGWGVGSAAGRLLSGTTVLHRELEENLAEWVGCDDAVLHGSCWTANAAVFATLTALASEARAPLAVFSDRLNHASIIDAIRAQRPAISHLELYGHDDPERLRLMLVHAPANTTKLIVTDGVFSMEGDQAPLRELSALADEFHALLVVDDSHGTGVVGTTGRGTAEAQGLLGRVDIITGTLGKALGGAGGGFVAGPASLMATLRKTSRPYVFSNNPPASIAAAALAILAILKSSTEPITTLRARVDRLRAGIINLELNTYVTDHPIVPVITGNERTTLQVAAELATQAIFATPLAYPVVPHGEDRIRLQVSAAHSNEMIDRVIDALRRSTALATNH